MARARNIKPGIFTNEDLAELPIEARFLFIGLWTMADREGRLEDRPKRIKMTIFPADAVDVEPMLAGLADVRLIIRYQVEGHAYIWIPGFAKHQKPHHREAASTIPPHLDAHAEDEKPHLGTAKDAPRHVPASPDSLNPSSLNPDCSSPKRRGRAAANWGPCPETVDETAWGEWTNYKGGAPKRATITKLTNLLSRYPPEIQRKAVDHSIANGYDGVFPEKFHEESQRATARPALRPTVEDKLANLRRISGEAEGGEGLDPSDRDVRGPLLAGVRR